FEDPDRASDGLERTERTFLRVPAESIATRAAFGEANDFGMSKPCIALEKLPRLRPGSIGDEERRGIRFVVRAQFRGGGIGEQDERPAFFERWRISLVGEAAHVHGGEGEHAESEPSGVAALQSFVSMHHDAHPRLHVEHANLAADAGIGCEAAMRAAKRTLSA